MTQLPQPKSDAGAPMQHRSVNGPDQRLCYAANALWRDRVLFLVDETSLKIAFSREEIMTIGEVKRAR
jgi:hypothetical protein